MHIVPLVFVAGVALFAANTLPALAGPYVYTNGALLHADLATCLSRAEKVASDTGFTQYQEKKLDNDKKTGTFYASKPDYPVSLVVRCSPNAGIVSIGISGINNKTTFRDYKKFEAAFF